MIKISLLDYLDESRRREEQIEDVGEQRCHKEQFSLFQMGFSFPFYPQVLISDV